jgi:hypothetical protein
LYRQALTCETLFLAMHMLVPDCLYIFTLLCLFAPTYIRGERPTRLYQSQLSSEEGNPVLAIALILYSGVGDAIALILCSGVGDAIALILCSGVGDAIALSAQGLGVRSHIDTIKPDSR